MVKLLVAGGAGFVGSALVSKLVAAGHQVLVLDAFRRCYDLSGVDAGPDPALLSGARVERGDLADAGLVRRLVSDFAPEVVVNLAAIPLVALAERHVEEARRTMLDGLATLLEAVRDERGVGRFVFVSSSMVYGPFASDPMPEDGPVRPAGIYGGLKLAGEVISRAHLAGTGTECTVVRPSAIYGPGDPHRRVVRVFCENALAGRPLTVMRTADARIDFTHLDDAARGLALAATHGAAGGETFNVTFGEAHGLSRLAELVAAEVPGARIETGPGDARRARRGALDISKARRLLGYEPRWPLERGVRALVARMRADAGA